MGDFEEPTARQHAYAAYSEWVALKDRLRSHDAVLVNGRDMTISDIVAVALLTDNTQDLKLIQDSVALLERELNAGNVVYGVNTGFGGSADTRTDHHERLQSAAIQHLNVGILLKADKTDPSSQNTPENGLLRSHALPTPIVKAAMLIRCNSLMRGHSGVRVSVIDAVMKLLSLDMTPVTPLRGSISASGDLSTLSYIAGAIEGNPDIHVRVGSKDGLPKFIPANEALELADLKPVRLQAKEGLGITNGTAPSCAAACLVIHQANQLALLTQLLTAMGTEALGGTAANYHPFISSVRPHTGQAEAASNILFFLSDSLLCPSPFSPSSLSTSHHRVGLAQDRYALRTAPQWIGPQLEDLLLATRQVTVELNSTTDNPLLNLATSTIHHGGNFQAAALTSAMEKTLLALQNLGRLLFAQSSELINNATNKGLPPNLSFDDPSASFTAKGFDVNMAAYAAELAHLTRPVSAHVQVAEMANQSVNSMALVAARTAMEAVEVLGLMCATYVYVLCQALDLRCVGDGKVEKVMEVVLGKWDVLAHLDLEERAQTTVSESLGAVLEILGEEASLERIGEYRERMVRVLVETYEEVRTMFVREEGTTTELISPASRVVYDFVRKELGISLNRGVEDHPPLLLRTAETSVKKAGSNGTGHGGELSSTGELKARSKTLGTMAGEIYEALRKGELHDRIMKFGEEAGFWGS
ncbi:hypothetical protein N0V88_006202 [Collariella sp. IMI 366227]|nr:hypothetical protein N0V88_006202 [Collariella sp. IMI 366227]